MTKLLWPLAAATLLVTTVAAVAALRRDEAPVEPPAQGFVDEVVLRGLHEPLAVAFAPDGRVFVAEKRGLVKVFADLDDRRPRVFADLRDHVYELGDHGIFGLAVDGRSRVYVLYTFDGPPGARAPVWHDECRGGANSGRCPVSGRLSHIGADGLERILVEGWCQQYSSHGVGALALGADGQLYASGGEGASFERVDTGEAGSVCGDPPREGGALRAQDARTSTDPLGLSGSVIAVDTRSGTRRHLAYGLRNPFRIAVRPGSGEVWIGDVGSTRSDELNVVDASTARVENFGWPCYEGERRLRSYDEADIPICEALYAEEDAATPPLVAFDRDEHVVRGDGCRPGTQALSGLAFYRHGDYPRRYEGALFFSDFARGCIWAMLPGRDGRPDPSRLELFRRGVRNAVYLTTGADGDLFYVDFFGGAVRRLKAARSGASGPAPANAVAVRTTAPVRSPAEADPAAGSPEP